VLPLLCFLALDAAGAAFIVGYSAAFNALAVAMLVILVLGIVGAWDLMIWMALTRARNISRS